ncbi:MAG: hypothetical protein Q8Q12_07390 [bacterium]|nr:hypothetical protein [bacterium]
MTRKTHPLYGGRPTPSKAEEQDPLFGIRQWNEQSIQEHIHGLLNRPLALSALITALRERFIINQNIETFQARIRFLRSVLEAVKLTKELQTALDDLGLHEKERKVRQLELELKTSDLEDQQRKQQELNDLRHEVEVLKLKLERDRVKKENEDLLRQPEPTKQEAPLTAEQRKAKEKKECEERIAALKAEKQKALKIEDEEERTRKVNALDAALELEYERWAKLL